MAWFITNLITAFLLPPLNFLMIFLMGLLLWRRYQVLARGLLILTFVLFWLCSTSYFSETGIRWLEAKNQALTYPLPDADAIVILGGGTYFHAPEYAYQDMASSGTLARLRYGAKLYRETHKPILVSGGKPLGDYVPESEQMRNALEQDFQIPVQWSEQASDNTFENAHNTFRLLQKSGVKKIYLVTHAWHLPRAAQAFRHAGFVVIDAPTAFTTRYETNVLTFLPNAGGLQNSALLFHELIGYVWYELRSKFN